jgi:hypothetical protein
MINLSVKNLSSDDDNNILPEPIQQKDIKEIIALDEIIFGANRTHLIKYLIREYPDKAWLVKRNNRITGFALGRDGNKYHHIGPVVASTTTDTKVLITKALEKLTDQPVIVDVLCDKEDLFTWLTSIGFIKQRHFIRMYKKENILPGITGKYYLICGPEFG